MRVHFIAIGGSAMHNLAIALHKKGFNVTGSDDEIFEPSKGRISKHGLLPDKFGWDESRITTDLDAVILGMHASIDNPELLKAQELGVKVYSYPEYIYEQSKDKKRVVIGGSHGKTSITSMVLHVLGNCNKDFDYMVGAQLEGFDTMVKLTDAKLIILEGDEYLSSPIDLRPKFHLYKPHIALISGIAWDHINVFPTFENYLSQFQIFINKIEDSGYLTYCSSDEDLNTIAKSNTSISVEPYILPSYKIVDGKTFIEFDKKFIPLEIFGEHNLINMMGAFNVCKQLEVSESSFLNAMSSFKGASHRLEKIYSRKGLQVFKDFAHSPSKVKATVKAVKSQFVGYNIIAALELHTFSSLNKTFLSEYKNSMNGVDTAIVYFDPEAITHKKLENLSANLVFDSFARKDLSVLTNSNKLCRLIESEISDNTILLLMSSGNFGGLVLEDFARSL